MASPPPRDAPPSVEHITAYIPISHEQWIDSGTHQCDDTCPPIWQPPPLSRRERITVWLRTAAWRIRQLPNYRLVHRDNICDHNDW